MHAAPKPLPAEDRPSRATLGVSECRLKPVDLNGRRVTRLVFRPTRAGPLRVAVLNGTEMLGEPLQAVMHSHSPPAPSLPLAALRQGV